VHLSNTKRVERHIWVKGKVLTTSDNVTGVDDYWLKICKHCIQNSVQFIKRTHYMTPDAFKYRSNGNRYSGDTQHNRNLPPRMVLISSWSVNQFALEHSSIHLISGSVFYWASPGRLVVKSEIRFKSAVFEIWDSIWICCVDAHQQNQERHFQFDSPSA
jgi:hypothetical protein